MVTVAPPDLFPPSIAVRVASLEMYDALRADEAVYVARAVEKRKREFSAGRAAARQALAAVGGGAPSLPVGPSRAPIWPSGFVGSISHCDGLCAAAAASLRQFESLGLDVEVADVLPEELFSFILTPEELRNVENLPGASGLWAKITFSAKEAFYKSYNPIWGKFLEFLDVRACFQNILSTDLGMKCDFSISMDSGNLPGRGMEIFEGRVIVDGNFIWSGMYVRQRV